MTLRAGSIRDISVEYGCETASQFDLVDIPVDKFSITVSQVALRLCHTYIYIYTTCFRMLNYK